MEIDVKRYLIMKPLKADVEIISGHTVHKKGNVWYKGTTCNFNIVMATAADTVFGGWSQASHCSHGAYSKGQAKDSQKNTLPLTAADCVNLIVTEMGVMEVGDHGIVLTEYNPEYTIEEIKAATEADLIISEQLHSMS